MRTTRELKLPALHQGTEIIDTIKKPEFRRPLISGSVQLWLSVYVSSVYILVVFTPITASMLPARLTAAAIHITELTGIVS